MIYHFDLDGVICTHEEDYNRALPHWDIIENLNKLYAQGNTILIETARGSLTGIDWHDVTKQQLKDWGVNYDILRCGTKFYADYYIDDKNLSIDEFKRILE